VLVELVEFALLATVVAAAAALVLTLFVLTLAADGGADVYSRLGKRPQRGLALTRSLWRQLRAGPLTRVLGPPPLRVAAFRDLLALTSVEFERACGRLLQDLGYTHVKRVGGPGDLALDLHARDPEGRSVAVQCKRYAPPNKVSSPDLQRFIGMARAHHGAERAIVMTTSTFTAAAASLARQHRIELWDGEQLAKLLEQQRRLLEAQGARPAITPS
jgi:hypothetical protein